VYVPAFSGVSEPPDLVRTTGTGVFLPARLANRKSGANKTLVNKKIMGKEALADGHPAARTTWYSKKGRDILHWLVQVRCR
jgi:hypothetical protein